MEIDWVPAGGGKVLHAVRRELQGTVRNSLCFQLCPPVPPGATARAGRTTKCVRCLQKVARHVAVDEQAVAAKPKVEKRKGKA